MSPVISTGLHVFKLFYRVLIVYMLSVASASAEFTEAQKRFLHKTASIKICVDPNWMPFEKINDRGEYEGILADYTNLFSKYLNIPFILHPTKSFPESINALEKGSCQLIVANIATKEMKEKFLATNVYFVSTRAFAIHSDSPFVGDFSKIAHKPTGVVANTPAEYLMPQLYPNINLVRVDSIDEGIQMLSSGELYSLINVLGALSYSLQSQSITNIKIGGSLSGGTPLSMLVNKDYAPLVDILNNAISLITEQDRAVIFEKWVPIKYEKGTDWVFFWKVIGGILVVFIIIISIVIFWNNTLRREILLRKKAERKLNFLAMTDSLTGLANRLKFFEKLDDAISLSDRQGDCIALAIIDIDNFKQINDKHGHPVGDALLIETGKRLIQSFRKIDTVARLGGDEFSVVIYAQNKEKDLTLLGKRILELFAQPVTVENNVYTVSISIGFALYKDHADTKNELINCADLALYQSKDSGKNSFSIYNRNEINNQEPLPEEATS